MIDWITGIYVTGALTAAIISGWALVNKISKSIDKALEKKIDNTIAEKITKQVNDSLNAQRKEICKDLHTLKLEIVEVKTDLKDHIAETKPLVDEFRRAQTDIAVTAERVRILENARP